MRRKRCNLSRDASIHLCVRTLGVSSALVRSDLAPFSLAAGAAGSLEMGGYISFGNNKRQSNDVLNTVHKYVTQTDDEQYGAASYSSGPLSGV